jgi:hypothetical protein
MPFFSPLPGQPKNMAIINSAILYVSARDLRLLNCRINTSVITAVGFIGAIASIVSLVLYLYDRSKGK